jgi:hypothetical protein
MKARRPTTLWTATTAWVLFACGDPAASSRPSAAGSDASATAGCAETTRQVELIRDELFAGSDRSCSTNADCSVIVNKTRCYYICARQGVALHDADRIRTELASIDAQHCDSFAVDGPCVPDGETSTSCAATWIATCEAGVCRANIQH